MDTIVAQYTRSPFQHESYSEEEQRNLTESLPPLSLKFDLPPVDNVGRPDSTLPTCRRGCYSQLEGTITET